MTTAQDSFTREALRDQMMSVIYGGRHDSHQGCTDEAVMPLVDAYAAARVAEAEQAAWAVMDQQLEGLDLRWQARIDAVVAELLRRGQELWKGWDRTGADDPDARIDRAKAHVYQQAIDLLTPPSRAVMDGTT